MASSESRASAAKMRRAWVDRWPKEVRHAMQSATVDAAEEVAQLQRSLAPVDQGDLRDSISVSISIDQPRAFITAGDTQSADSIVSLTRRRSGKAIKAYYGVLVEYGTKNRPATPFFWPAWRAMKIPIKRRIARLFAKTFKSGAMGRSPLK